MGIWGRALLLLGLHFLTISCGSRSLAGEFVELTEEQEARQALDDQDFAKAVELYNGLIQAQPEAFQYYPFLATAYAGLAGFDILKTLLDTVLSSAEQSSLQAALQGSLPEDPSEQQLSAIKAALDTLMSMPEDHRSLENKAISYATSAAIQLQFYQIAYPLLLMNKFVGRTTDGSLDPARLATMSEEDALAILESLQAVQAAGGVLGESTSSILAAIDQQPGANNKEKLANYLAQRG